MPQLMDCFNHTRARLTLIAGSYDQTGVLSHLKASGYEVCVSDDQPAAGTQLLIIDLRCSDNPLTFANTRKTGVRAYGSKCGVVVIAPTDLPVEARAELERLGDLLIAPAPQTLLSMVRRKLRLGAVADEAALRLGSVGLFAPRATLYSGRSDASPTGMPQKYSVLLSGEPSPEILAVSNAFDNTRYELTCVFSAAHALRAAQARRFDAAVFVPGSDHDPLYSMSKYFLRNLKHPLPPVLFIGDADRIAKCCDAETCTRHEFEFDNDRRMSTFIRRARLRETLERALRMRHSNAVWDDEKGAYTLAFCAFHANRLFEETRVWKQPVSLIAIRSTCQHRSTSMRTMIKKMGTALRVTDLISAVSADTIIVICRGLTNPDSQKVAERLEGLLANFTRSDDIGPALIGVATRQPDERFEETLAQALMAIRRRRIRVRTNG